MSNQRAKYCLLCGDELSPAEVEGRRRLRCKSCSFVLYLNPAAASAGLVLDEHDRVLLVQRAIEPYKGSWALPAGYQEADEESGPAVEREIQEECGLRVKALGLLDLFYVPDPGRKPANVALHLCRPLGGELRAAEDAAAVDWFPLDRLPADIGFGNREQVFDRLRPGGDLHTRVQQLRTQ